MKDVVTKSDKDNNLSFFISMNKAGSFYQLEWKEITQTIYSLTSHKIYYT